MPKVAGGLLRGLGAGLMRRAEIEREDQIRAEDREREDELMMRERAHQRAAEIRNQIFTSNENRLDRESREASDRSSRADRIAADTADRVSRENEGAADRASREKIASMPSRSSREDESGISASDQRLIDTIAPQFTTVTTDEITGKETGKVVDWKGIAAHLRRMPSARADLADYIEGTNPSRQESATHGRRRADVGGRSGSRSNPARPTTQEEFDALPSGAIYVDPDEEGGKLYRKP